MSGHGKSAPEHPIPAIAGIGLRFAHLEAVETCRPPVGLLECHTENLFCLSEPVVRRLEALRVSYPFSLHSTGLSLGSADGIDQNHLRKVCGAVARYDPMLVSDHLSWSRIDNISVPDLFPLPFDLPSLTVLADNIDRVQNALSRAISVENLSVYLVSDSSTMTEAEFLAELVSRTGCGLLVDLNNLHVNQLNFGSDPLAFLDAIPVKSVRQYHLAGPQQVGDTWIDTHSTRVPQAVWRLFEYAVRRIGPRPTIVEWDQNLPVLDVLVQESNQAASILSGAGEIGANTQVEVVAV